MGLMSNVSIQMWNCRSKHVHFLSVVMHRNDWENSTYWCHFQESVGTESDHHWPSVYWEDC